MVRMNFIFIFISSSDTNLLRKKSVKQKIKRRWPYQCMMWGLHFMANRIWKSFLKYERYPGNCNYWADGHTHGQHLIKNHKNEKNYHSLHSVLYIIQRNNLRS